jgi:hypothetical protein
MTWKEYVFNKVNYMYAVSVVDPDPDRIRIQWGSLGP